MKKLMISAAAVAMTAGAFALPEVYDYKASVKHLYLKEVKVSYNNARPTVYQKFQKSSSLKGYLIMDNDGVTSPTVNNAVAAGEWYGNGFDYGRNRGFLVVQNASVEKAVKAPKILPVVLDAKWMDTAFAKTDGVTHSAKNGLAEGTLFVGGDAVACVREQLDNVGGVVRGRGAAPALPVAAGAPGMTAYADYVWTSVYLFGQFNGPNWFEIPEQLDEDGNVVAPAHSPFAAFETEWDKNLPELLRRGWVADATPDPINYYHDTWMNGAGVGKWVRASQDEKGEICCGITKKAKTNWSPYILDSLSGNLKGGLFLCTENGIDAEDPEYNWFDTLAWEDQFVTARLEDGTGLFAADSWQNDMWLDGPTEQETTDVIFGTWSIKRIATDKFFGANGIARALPASLFEARVGGVSLLGDATKNSKNTDMQIVDEALWSAIYGAAFKLKSDVNFYDGTEIYGASIANRFKVPMLTPQFVEYYRLVNKVQIN